MLHLNDLATTKFCHGTLVFLGNHVVITTVPTLVQVITIPYCYVCPTQNSLGVTVHQCWNSPSYSCNNVTSIYHMCEFRVFQNYCFNIACYRLLFGKVQTLEDLVFNLIFTFFVTGWCCFSEYPLNIILSLFQRNRTFLYVDLHELIDSKCFIVDVHQC